MSRRFLSIFLVLALGLCLAVPALAESTPETVVAEARDVLLEMTLDKKNNDFPAQILKDAAGVVIIPGMVRVGVILGGSYGKGVIFRKTGDMWRGPAFLEMTAGSVGLQLGVQSMDLILVITNDKGMDSFLETKGQFGADFALTAGPVGADAAAAKDTGLKATIYSYARARGLFAGVSLKGAGASMLPSWNEKYTTLADSNAILSGQGNVPGQGKDLADLIYQVSHK